MNVRGEGVEGIRGACCRGGVFGRHGGLWIAWSINKYLLGVGDSICIGLDGFRVSSAWLRNTMTSSHQRPFTSGFFNRATNSKDPKFSISRYENYIAIPKPDFAILIN